jgi:hypothetical protein
MDECLIFQKLTNQELIILSALDHLDGETKTTKHPRSTNKKGKQKNDSSSDDSLDDDSDDSDDDDN